MLSEISRKGMIYLSKESKVEIIEGASHRFDDKTDKIAELAIKWYDNSVK